MIRLKHGVLAALCLTSITVESGLAACRPASTLVQRATTIDEGLLVLPPIDDHLSPPEGWAAVGGVRDPVGCVDFGANRSPVFARPAAVLSATLPGEPDRPFDIRLIVPKAEGAQPTETLRHLAAALAKVSSFFPLGFDEESSSPFFVVQGVDRPDRPFVLLPGRDLAVINVPLDDPLFETQALRAAAHIYFERGHPDAGPESRRRYERKVLDPSSTEVISYSAYRDFATAWIAIDQLDGTERRLYLAQRSILDALGSSSTVPGAPANSAKLQDAGVASSGAWPVFNGVDWLDELTNNVIVDPTDKPAADLSRPHAYLSKGDYAPLAAALFSAHVRANGRTSLSALLRALHGKGDPAAERWLLRKSLAETLQSREYLVAVLVEMVRVNAPLWQRPANLGILSGHAVLDTRLYRATASRSETAFLITHGVPRPAAYDVFAKPLIDRLLMKGDVLVVHRGEAGRTTEGLPEGFGDCDQPNYWGTATNGGQHIADAARWLYTEGYERIIVMASGGGAFAVLASSPDLPPGAQLVLVDPVRGVPLIGTGLCQVEALERLASLLKRANKLRTLVIANENYRTSSRPLHQAIDRYLQSAFPEAVRVRMPNWLERERWYFELAPEFWIDHLEAFMK